METLVKGYSLPSEGCSLEGGWFHVEMVLDHVIVFVVVLFCFV